MQETYNSRNLKEQKSERKNKKLHEKLLIRKQEEINSKEAIRRVLRSILESAPHINPHSSFSVKAVFILYVLDVLAKIIPPAYANPVYSNRRSKREAERVRAAQTQASLTDEERIRFFELRNCKNSIEEIKEEYSL